MKPAAQTSKPTAKANKPAAAGKNGCLVLCGSCCRLCARIPGLFTLYIQNLVAFSGITGSLIAFAYLTSTPRAWYYVPVLAVWLFFVFSLFHFVEVTQPSKRVKASPVLLLEWTNTAGLVYSYVSCARGFLFSTFLYSSVLAVVYFLFLELIWTAGSQTVFTSSATFSDSPVAIAGFKIVAEAAGIACIVQEQVDNYTPLFFEVTNNPAVIAWLTAFGGVYFDLMFYRERARNYLTGVYPQQQIACNGLSNTVNFQQSNLCLASLVLICFMVFLVPFSAFTNARQTLASPLLWLVVLILSTLIGIDLFVGQDVSTFVIGQLTETYNKTITTYGATLIGLLAVIVVASVLLIVPAVTPSTKAIHPRGARTTIAAFLRSQGFVFMLVGLGLSVWVMFAGFPITRVGLVSSGSNQRPLPTYAAYNSFELSVLQSTGLESLLLNVITNFTNVTNLAAQEIVGFIVGELPSICVPTGISGSVCVSGSTITNAFDSISDQLAGLIEEGEVAVIDTVYSDLVTLIDDAANGAATNIENGLKFVVSQIAFLYHDALLVFQPIEDIFNFFASLFPYAPILVVAALVVTELVGQYIPSFRKFGFIAIVTVMFQLLFVLVYAYFSIQNALSSTFSYRINITWNMPVLLLDVVTFEVLLVASYMLYTFHDEELDQEETLRVQIEHYLQARHDTAVAKLKQHKKADIRKNDKDVEAQKRLIPVVSHKIQTTP
jgi:hypothetical protein